ncbi:MAG: hypothetical protein KGZ82_14295 [Bacteroidales bacterium]|nr:hypothetical protein [Bacteroidales bacterium]
MTKLKPAMAFLAVVFMLISTSCQRNPSIVKADPEFAAYVSAFSTGFIPVDAPIVVQLSSKPDVEAVLGQEIDQQLFSFKPSIAGKAYWMNETQIRFIPDQLLPYDQVLEVSFFLNKIRKVEEKFHIFRFSIRTLPITFSVEPPVLEAYQSTDYTWNSLKGVLVFSNQIELKKIDGLMQAKLNTTSLRIKVLATETPEVFHYVIDSIQRTDARQQLILSWDGKTIGSKVSGSETISIPSIGTFKVEKVKVINSPEQRIEIYFSDPVSQTQLIDGLVYLDKEVKVNLKCEKNKVLVYPDQVQGGTFTMVVAAGIENSAHEKLGETYSEVISFDKPKPAVKFTGKGTIMTSSNKRQLPFQAIGLSAVDVQVVQVFESNVQQFLQWNSLDGSDEINRVGRLVAKKRIELGQQEGMPLVWKNYSIDLDKLLGNQTASIYRVYLSFKQAYAIIGCPPTADAEHADIAAVDIGVSEKALSQWEFQAYYDPDYYYPDNFNWQERDDPCSPSYYYSDHFASKNVLVSDIGLIAKNADLSKREYLFYTNNLLTTSSIPGVKVKMYDFQQQLICEGLTNEQGEVRLSAGMVKPFLAIASDGQHQTYLKLDPGFALAVSRFDVGGEQTQQGFKGFVYTERGVYRPGDTIFMAFILRGSDEKLPENYPVVCELYNARQQMVAKQTSVNAIDGIFVFKLPTSPESPTGLWLAKITAGSASFDKRIRVETIKPNRLKVKFDFGLSQLSYTDRKQPAELEVSWLHGAKASGIETSLEMTAIPDKIAFNKFNGFVFEDNSRYFYTEQVLMAKGQTDADGKFKFKLDIPAYHDARGRLKLNFVARAMEPGGDITTAIQSMEYNPFSRYVGIRPPAVNASGFLTTDTTQTFEIAVLNHQGLPVDVPELLIEIFKMDWSWWWSGNGSDKANYISTPTENLVYRETVAATNGKALLRYKLKYPSWGNYFVRVRDVRGGHSASVMTYFDWPDWYSRDGRANRGGASLITVSCDKEQYHPGEKAHLSFPSPVAGKALVSIESGSRQLKSFWINTVAGETMVEIPIEKGYSPNVYAHITMLQPHDKVANDLPIRLYGIVPLMVEDIQTRLIPEINVADEIRPEQYYEVSISEKNGNAMAYTLAVVDEGLLDLTNFKTPDPHAWFYAKEAAGLNTWDMYDEVLGAYGGRIEQVFTIGGDEAMMVRERARQSRFKPVVKFIGPFYLKANSKQLHKLKTTDYVGSVKVMVVAASGSAFGDAQKTVKVKQPLMVLASLPRVLRPGDALSMPVNVFSSIEGSHQVNITVTFEGNCVQSEAAAKQLVFSGPAEKMTAFDLKVNDISGVAKIHIEAKSGKETANLTTEIAVQNPNDRIFFSHSNIVEPGATVTSQLNLIGNPADRQASIEVSGLPSVSLEKRIKYLTEYPYGCSEQIAAAGFAQLNLSGLIDENQTQQLSIEKNIQSAIIKLAQRQRSDGAVVYWPGSAVVNEWADVFSGHFMLLAFKAGKPVPSIFMPLWQKNQRKMASGWEPVNYKDALLNDLLQAYRLYVLALSGDPQMSAMNRLRENPRLSLRAATTLAAAYAISGQDAAARQLALGLVKHNASATDNDADFGSDIRHKSMRLETLLLLNEHENAIALMKEIADELDGGAWLSTQSTAWGIHAWKLFAMKYSTSGMLDFTINQGSSNIRKKESKSAIYSQALNTTDKEVKVTNMGDKPFYISSISSGIPLRGESQLMSKGLELTVTYLDENGKPIDFRSLRQGTRFTLVATITNTSGKSLKNLVLNQLMPAGWEIVNNSLFSEAVATEKQWDYQDVRDDRAITYFGLPAGSSRKFVTEAIASYQGFYQFPAAVCTDMYDHAILATSGETTVSVQGVKQGRE